IPDCPESGQFGLAALGTGPPWTLALPAIRRPFRSSDRATGERGSGSFRASAARQSQRRRRRRNTMKFATPSPARMSACIVSGAVLSLLAPLVLGGCSAGADPGAASEDDATEQAQATTTSTRSGCSITPGSVALDEVWTVNAWGLPTGSTVN